MTFAKRYVALGDSFTEGVGDPDPGLPNGVRGWADRVAEQLCRADPEAGYANLAIRGRKLARIMHEQIDAAVELRPTLVTIYAGGNDILRPQIDIDQLMQTYDDGIARLAATGADVVMFTGFDAVASPVFSKMRGRTAIYNELLREVADKHEAMVVDYWRFDEYNDPRMWDTDRLHMSTAGHINMAAKVLDKLEAEHAIELPQLQELAPAARLEALKADAAWVRRFVGPWVGRRLRGVSSGDALTARYPQLQRVGDG
ncbi:SGNH/GDSL hydrolase family protein [Arthrobacter castelli]|uniref:SGNH/GDSL hydrolase family protein n=1 Tax=Arthrobacter castelli TaxID=271431 RepID=UPI00047D9595|nr:SGNH/GDSL hydrolase family protein [Arthrobacter castelli]